MTKTKSTKRALLTSALALIMCISMLVGSTFAWFTDSVVSGSNVITAGNLDIDVQYTLDGENWKDLDGANDLFQKGLWEPGHTEVVALRLKNNGTLALKYIANMNIIGETVGKNKDGEDIVLSDILTVSTLVQEAGQIGDIAVMLAFMGENAGGLKYEKTVAFKSANVLADTYNLEAGAERYVIIKVDMAETVGNEANHDGKNVPSINFGINVLATQYTSESDSFGNQYDVNATLPIVDADALREAMTNGGIYVLDADIDVDANTTMTVPAGKEVILNLNGHQINATSTETGKNRNVFTVKGNMVVTGNGTMSTVHSGDNMKWNNSVSIFSVEGGSLTLNEGVTVANNGGSDMAYGVDVNSTAGESVLNVNGATVVSTYTAVREFNNHKTAKAIVNLNSGILAGDSRDLWVHNPSAKAVDANGVVNFAPEYVYTLKVQDTSYNSRIYNFDYGYTVVNSASALQTALDNAVDGDVIKFGSDINGNATVTQKADVKITIDGNGKTFNGVMTVFGNGRKATAGLTIKNIDFVAANGASSCIVSPDRSKNNAYSYSSNVTVENCTFTDLDGVVNCAAVRHEDGGDSNWKIIDCTVDNTMHSLIQTNNVEIDGLTIQGCEVYSKNGINLNQCTKVSIIDCKIDVKGYAVRYGVGGATVNGTFEIKDSTLKSANDDGDAVIIFRGTMTGSTLTITNTTIVGTPEISGNANVVR